MLIRVTAGDVAAGVPCHGDRCPVAIAVRRATGFEYVTVGKEAVTVSDGWRVVRSVGHPFEVGERIAAYDLGRGMEPFEFELDLEPKGGPQ